MYCRQCGQALPEDAVICPNCHTPINERANADSETNGQTPPNPQTPPYQNTQQNGTGYTQPNQSPYVSGPKNRIVAGVLGVLLGALGIHNFYLGYTGRALAQLLLTVCSCGIFSPITAIWGLVEGILILVGNVQTDASGTPLKD